ncbi:hypothetical protein [Corallococcus macrosporus]|uniref:hypothetical protein n=1 Tax=Corallococcus macrosporus TaxID=35 RepID=UPI000305DDC6|nr:hypothetical protein [Corallococcus macrosporus]
MSRIDPPGSSSLPTIDTTPETGGPPSPSRAAEPRAQVSPHRNELRAFDGSAAKTPEPTPRGGSTPASAGPARSAGELAVLGGWSRPGATKEPPTDVLEDLRARLTRSLENWTVGADDVRAVHTALGGLPSGTYRATLERMQHDGLLSAYVKAQDAGARLAFLEQAESKGVLQRRNGEAGPVGALGYPAVPDVFVNDRRLPEAMRDAVNAHATDVGAGFYRAHAEYLGRYARAVDGAQSLQELGALGPPRAAHLPESILGLEWKDPARRDYETAWKGGIGQPKSLNLTLQHVSARQRELSGERAGGTVRLHGKVGVSNEHVQWGAKAALDTRGHGDLKGEVGVAARNGPVGIEVSHDSAGDTDVKLKLKLGLAELSLDSDGEQRVAVGVGTLFQVHAALNPKKAELGGGVSAKFKADDGSQASVEAGFSMKGLTAERAGQAVDREHRGVFQPPAELASRTAWDALPEATRATYAKEGWNREAWTRALPR